MTRSSPPPSLNSQIVRIGQRRAYLNDGYAYLLRAKWRHLIAFCATMYLIVNAFFASLYVLLAPTIGGSNDGSYFDAFFFSIQTLATIGYGVMYPVGTAGHVLVGVEALVGLLGFAILTGIVFTKFARPSAGVVFSRVAVITHHDGGPCLLLRCANERGSEIVEASMRLSALMDASTREGKRLRRFHDLKLERSSTPILMMSWLVIHRIDESSPLYGKTQADMERGDVRILANLTGMDGTFMQTVYSYHSYEPADVLRGVEFEDIIGRTADGRPQLDLRKFHDVKPDH